MRISLLAAAIFALSLTANATEKLHKFSGEKIDFECKDAVLKQATKHSVAIIPFPEDGKFPEIESEFDFKFYCGENEEIDVRVYPKSILEPLKTWSKENTIRVLGAEDNLTDFLEKAEIEYLLPHELAPEGKSALIINHSGLKKDEELPKDFTEDLVILIRDKTEYDIEYIISGERGFVEIEGNINWDFTNPLHHKLLIKTFRRAL